MNIAMMPNGVRQFILGGVPVAPDPPPDDDDDWLDDAADSRDDNL